MPENGGEEQTNGPAETPSATYALRIQPRAEQDIRGAVARFAELSGDEIATEWYDGLYQHLATLATNPSRCPLAREDRLFRRNVRQLVYRRTASSPAYRILFTIVSSVDDAPAVVILHIRHGAARPLTRLEAQAIEEAE